MTDTFFFFGCWNKDNCPDSCITDCAASDCQLPNHRKMVLTNLATKSFNFGIIAGDNIYPVKQKTKAGKDKKYYLETLNRGIEDLKDVKAKLTVGKKIKVAVGNHNASPGVSAEQNKLFTDPFTLYEDAVTHVEYPSPGETKQYDLIFINTNYEASEINTGLSDDLFKKCGNMIYVIGHEPLIAAKLKGGKFTIMKCAHVLLEKLLSKIHEGKNIIYLCADVHNFQALTILKDGITLPVIVAGTGGAEPDQDIVYAELNKTETLDINNMNYNVTLHAKALPYGYCLINGKNITYHTHNNPNSKLHPTNVGGLTVSIVHENQDPIYVNPGEDCKFEKVLHPPPKKE